MYIPTWFREERSARLHGLIRAHPFAPIITTVDGSAFATHLPFLLDAERGPFGTLRAHMARANAQWRGFAEGQESLVIFQGPHAYISPSWYLEQPAVPTWNYAVAHVYGVPRIVDGASLNDILTASLARFEGPDDSYSLPVEYLRKMAAGIVGFEIEIARIEGKAKLSQNRSEEERRRVIEALRARSDPGDLESAEWMAASMEGD